MTDENNTNEKEGGLIPEPQEPQEAEDTGHLAPPEDTEDYGSRYHIEYPKLIKKFGVWPVNVGLFFFYNNVVSLVVLLAGLLIMHSNGVTDPRLVNEKLGGLSIISSLITLGLTLIYSKKFYFTRN